MLGRARVLHAEWHEKITYATNPGDLLADLERQPVDATSIQNVVLSGTQKGTQPANSFYPDGKSRPPA